MRTTLQVLLATACVTTLSECGSKKDVNKSNFGEAIQASLDKDGDVCLTDPGQAWPVDVSDRDIAMSKIMGAGTSVQMAALQTVGIVDEQPAILTVKPMFGTLMQQINVHRYTLTD